MVLAAPVCTDETLAVALAAELALVALAVVLSEDGTLIEPAG